MAAGADGTPAAESVAVSAASRSASKMARQCSTVSSAPVEASEPPPPESTEFPAAPPSPQRPKTSPAGGAAEWNTNGYYIPNYSNARIEAFVVDKQKRRTFPPRLREHLHISRLLRAGDFKRCLTDVAVCLREAGASTARPEETQEEAAAQHVARECSLVGPIDDPRVRQVLLLWILAVCLEAVGEVWSAVLLFSRCLALDPESPTHPYHRGVCLLRLGRPKAAFWDFQLAVTLCAERGIQPPLTFIANRALAGAAMPERVAEVWQDFERARQHCRKWELPAHLARGTQCDFEAYKEMISTAVAGDAVHRHWVSVLVARCHRSYQQTVSEIEALSFIRFLRGLAGMASMTRAVVMKKLPEFSTRQVAEGEVVLLEANWYCVLDGSLDVVRFLRSPPPGEAQLAYLKRRQMQEQQLDDGGAAAAKLEGDADPLRMPDELEELPELQVASALRKQATFRGGDAFGPEGDGWIVAGVGGVELLVCSLHKMRALEKTCGGLQAQVEADVKLLSSCALFKSCPPHVLLTMVGEIFERREALGGEDPMALWDGLVVIREGELQLWADEAAPRRPGSPGGSSAGGTSVGTSTRSSTRGPTAAQELCTLGPGDALGEEKLFGGPPAIAFTRSRVVSFRLEAWVLPPERWGDAEDIGLLCQLRPHRDAERRELQERARAAIDWARARPKALNAALQPQRTIDYVQGEVNPPRKVVGGVVNSWKPRAV